MTFEPPDCLVCRHYDRAARGHPPRCRAFPDGIPAEVWGGYVEHVEPLEGDGGIRFERDEEADLI
jgi:hypothetical protein